MSHNPPQHFLNPRALNDAGVGIGVANLEAPQAPLHQFHFVFLRRTANQQVLLHLVAEVSDWRSSVSL